MTNRSFCVNGIPTTLPVSGSSTLLDALRDGGLTGTKRGCDMGTCGACTVLVDNVPKLSCVTPAAAVEGCRITTVEGLSQIGIGKRLQEAFGKCGASQCGACTPGMLASLVPYLEANPVPTQEGIRAAIGSNLCRCTGYEAIVASAMEVCGVDPEYAAPAPKAGRVIGQPTVKVDAPGKADGRAIYVEDLSFPDQLHGAILRSPNAHARILSLDTKVAQAMSGVHLVLTGEDFTRRYGIFPYVRDEFPLARGKVRYQGEAVAAAIADTIDIARAACAAIIVEYEKLPFALTAEEALKPNAPIIHEVDHRDRPKSDNVANIAKPIHLGDVEGAFARATHIVEGNWQYGGNTHAAIEPHGAIGLMAQDGRLTLYSATQVSHYLRREVAHVLGIPEETLHVIQPTVGGGFGGKSDLFDFEFCAAEAARRLGRPVRFIVPREHVYALHRGRHPVHYHQRMAVDQDGNILAVELVALLAGGAQYSYGFVTRYYVLQLLGPMRIGAFHGEAIRAYTNTAPCGPKRGHGGPQETFALQTALDELGVQIGLDPIDHRRRIALRSGETTVNGFTYGSSGILECLDAVEAASGWRERINNLAPYQGLGASMSSYITGTAWPVNPKTDTVQTIVAIDLLPDGHVVIRTAVNEIGQGVNTVLAQVVAETLGCSLDLIDVHTGDTDLPKDAGAYSSRLTFMAGRAAKQAAEKIREHVGSGRTMTVTGEYVTEEIRGGDYDGSTIGASPAYSTTAYVAEVEVDPHTGIIRVTNIWCAHDCGRAINPTAVMGQIEGSIYMTWAETVLEHMDYNPNTGLHIGPNLLDSPIPVAADTPNIHAIIVESLDPKGPYGAKEAGEGPALGVPAAIANAIFRATGVRVRRVPIRPEDMLAALKRVAQGETHVVIE